MLHPLNWFKILPALLVLLCEYYCSNPQHSFLSEATEHAQLTLGCLGSPAPTPFVFLIISELTLFCKPRQPPKYAETIPSIVEGPSHTKGQALTYLSLSVIFRMILKKDFTYLCTQYL